MAGADPVHSQLLILSSERESPAILAAHILATSAQPDRLMLKVWLLVRIDVPSIQVMQSLYIVVAILVHGGVALP